MVGRWLRNSQPRSPKEGEIEVVSQNRYGEEKQADGVICNANGYSSRRRMPIGLEAVQYGLSGRPQKPIVVRHRIATRWRGIVVCQPTGIVPRFLPEYGTCVERRTYSTLQVRNMNNPAWMGGHYHLLRCCGMDYPELPETVKTPSPPRFRYPTCSILV